MTPKVSGIEFSCRRERVLRLRSKHAYFGGGTKTKTPSTYLIIILLALPGIIATS